MDNKVKNTTLKSKLIADDPSLSEVVSYISSNKENLPRGTIASIAREFGFKTIQHASHVISGKAANNTSNVNFLSAVYAKVKEFTERAQAVRQTLAA